MTKICCVQLVRLLLEFSVIPTAIRTDRLYYLYHHLCISPNVSDTFKDCTEIRNGTNLVFVEAKYDDCNLKHMLFVHKADGSIIHNCSGMHVCRDASYNLVLSRQCENDDNMFERTTVRTLGINCFVSHIGCNIYVTTMLTNMEIPC